VINLSINRAGKTGLTSRALRLIAISTLAVATAACTTADGGQGMATTAAPARL